MPSFHGLRLLQWLSSANEEDEREVLMKLSISSVVIRSGEEALELLPGDVSVYVGICVFLLKGKSLCMHLLCYCVTEFKAL